MADPWRGKPKLPIMCSSTRPARSPDHGLIGYPIGIFTPRWAQTNDLAGAPVAGVGAGRQRADALEVAAAQAAGLPQARFLR
jgi:hypothetical protein